MKSALSRFGRIGAMTRPARLHHRDGRIALDIVRNRAVRAAPLGLRASTSGGWYGDLI